MPGHVGVIQMAMRVDESRQQNHVAEVNDFLAIFPWLAPKGAGEVWPGLNVENAVAPDGHGAFPNCRSGEGKHHASAQDHRVQPGLVRALFP